jgi:hypothetical protein
MRVQEIAKILNKAGLKKAYTKNVNFQTVRNGDYEVREFNYNGVNCYFLPVNGMKVETIIEILTNSGLKVENRKGYATVLK